MAKVTSNEVAREAGVSRTTVSFVLNDKPGANISAETRQRVLDAARKLNYVPDARARNLATGKTKVIALAVHQTTPFAFVDTYLSSVLSGVVRKAKEAGFRITIAPTQKDSEVTSIANMLRGGEVDGMIAAGWSNEDLLTGAGITAEDPVLLLSERPIKQFAYVGFDLLAAQRKIVGAALQRGHKRFGVILYNAITESDSLRSRYEDFVAQIDEAGAEIVTDCSVEGALTVESGKEAMAQILATQNPPSVVFGMNDTMALGAVQKALETGLSVPEDISVIGFEGQPLTEFTSPPIATVKVPWVNVGEHAATLLLDMLNKPGSRPTASVDSELLIRESLREV